MCTNRAEEQSGVGTLPATANVTVHYTATARMIARANLAGVRHSGITFWSLLLMVVVIPASQLVRAVAWDYGVGKWTWVSWYLTVISPAYSLFSFLLIPYLEAVWRLRYMPAAWSAMSVGVDASGVSITGGNVPRTIGWSAISRVVETREFLLFFQGPLHATFVPLSAFASPQELADFRQVLIDAHRLSVPRARRA